MMNQHKTDLGRSSATGIPQVSSGLRNGVILDHRYEILQLVTKGEIFTTYLAKDLPINQLCFLKLFHRSILNDPEDMDQLRRPLLNLHHPNIARVYGLGRWRSQPYIVMEYMPCESLENILRKHHHIQLDRAVSIFSQICDALVYAHSKNVFHGSLSPSNIMLVGDQQTVVVFDFGIVSLLSQSYKGLKNLAPQHAFIETLSYASPEQYSNGIITKRSDIYSLGWLMHVTLTGDKLINANTPPGMIRRHMLGARALRLSATGELGHLIKSALQPEPSNRPRSASEFKSLLVNRPHAQRENKTVKIVVNKPTPAKANSSALGLGLAVVAAMSIGLAVSYWQASGPWHAEIVADRQQVANHDGAVANQTELQSENNQSTQDNVWSEAKRQLDQQHEAEAYRIYQRILDGNTAITAEQQLDLLQTLADMACDLQRPSEALDYAIRLRQIVEVDRSETLGWVLRKNDCMAKALLLAGRYEPALQMAKTQEDLLQSRKGSLSYTQVSLLEHAHQVHAMASAYLSDPTTAIEILDKARTDLADTDNSPAKLKEKLIFTNLLSAAYTMSHDRKRAAMEATNADRMLQQLNNKLLNRTCAQSFQIRAAAFAKNGNWEAAIDSYTQAVGLNPGISAYYRERSVAYEKHGQKELALIDQALANKLDESSTDRKL
jgi:serine/threonine protein kinase